MSQNVRIQATLNPWYQRVFPVLDLHAVKETGCHRQKALAVSTTAPIHLLFTRGSQPVESWFKESGAKTVCLYSCQKMSLKNTFWGANVTDMQFRRKSDFVFLLVWSILLFHPVYLCHFSLSHRPLKEEDWQMHNDYSLVRGVTPKQHYQPTQGSYQLQFAIQQLQQQRLKAHHQFLDQTRCGHQVRCIIFLVKNVCFHLASWMLNKCTAHFSIGSICISTFSSFFF